MSVLNENVIIGASAQGGYDIPNSLRVEDGDSAYLSRTPSSAGNRKTWTWSGWVKRGNLGTEQEIFAVTSNETNSPEADEGRILFTSGDILRVTSYVSSAYQFHFQTTAVFRDASAWYHVALKVDTTQSTASNRVKLYVNGEQVTAFTTETYPALNDETPINTTYTHKLCKLANYSTNYLDGYLSEINFIDGQALTPDSFGETGDYGEWIPKKYVGTYGTNGFYLDFKDSGSLGNDAVGSNNWTPTNLAATDQMLDSPTNNFATWNPIDTNGVTFSEGSLKTIADDKGTTTTILPSDGKWYWETVLIEGYNEAATPLWLSVGICLGSAESTPYAGHLGTGAIIGQNSNNSGFWINGVFTTAYTSWANGDIVGIAYDVDALTLAFYKNGVKISADLAITSSDNVISSRPVGASDDKSTLTTNFGQDSSFAGNKTAQGNSDSNGIGDFYYAPPDSFLALCTKSLPDATVVPSEHFNTVLYTGDGTANRRITGVGFQPDFVWHKARSATHHNELHDAVRGAGLRLISNGTYAEANHTAQFNSFDVDGFTVSEGNKEYNEASTTYVNWNWKAGGTGVTNTDGTITSTVSANVDAGFSIVSYSGNTTTGATVGHGLTLKEPEIVIFKRRNGVTDWHMYHAFRADAAGTLMYLNTTSAGGDSASFLNDTAPNSSVITLGSSAGTNGSSMLAYAFHSVDGYSKVGSYVGNGSADGPMVYTGFRPRYILWKNTSAAGTDWDIYDTERDTSNLAYKELYANITTIESASTVLSVDILSNGFKLRTSNGNANGSGNTFVYLAFAESPFKHSNAR